MSRAELKAIAIGGSAGSLHSLSAILGGLRADIDMAIFITVHVPSDRRSVLAEVLTAKCAVTVFEAEDKAPICPGTAYVAPPDYHLLIENNGTLALSSDEPVFYSRPAIDVMFESAADVYGEALLGIVLSGANADGAAGLRAIADAGGVPIIEDPDQAYAPSMPQAALTACPGARVMSLAELAEFLKSL